MRFDLPLPRWICLRTADGKLLARFDAQRGLLEIVQRGERHLFDLMTLEMETVMPPVVLVERCVVEPEGGTSAGIKFGV